MEGAFPTPPVSSKSTDPVGSSPALVKTGRLENGSHHCIPLEMRFTFCVKDTGLGFFFRELRN